MNVWLPDHPAADGIGVLPSTVTLNVIPRKGAFPDDFDRVEFRRHVERQPLVNVV